MAKDKEFNIKINGLKEGINDSEKFSESMKNSKKATEDQKKTVGDYSKVLREANKEIKNIQGQMLGLEKGSKQWKELSKKAGEYKDRIDDIREATKRWASDTKQLDDVINLAQSATAAFTLYKGAMSAFGMETEKAEEAIQKLAGAMSIIQSLQALQNALKGSSATAALMNSAMKALTFGIEGTTVATKALKVALASIGIGLVLIAVGELIARWDELCDWFNKSFPMFDRLGGAMNALMAVIRGVGNVVVNWLINPWKTFAAMVQKVLKGDFAGAIEEAINGLKRQSIGVIDAFKEGFQAQVEKGLEEISKKTLEETNKQTKYQLDMLKAKMGNDAKYTKAGIALQKKDFAERRKLAKGNKDELNKINLEEANFCRECQEHKAAAAKKSADERKKAEKAAADEAKKLEAEAERKRKEEEKAAEEARRKELERIKELNSARKDGADLEIEYQKAVLDERKRVVNESLSGEEKVIKKLEDEINTLKKIANNDRLSKKTRMQATVQLEAAMAKLMRAEENRKNLLDQQAELEREILRLNKEKSENAVYEELRNNLQMFKASKEELTALIDGTSDKLGDLSETQQQYVDNAKKQIMTIARTYLTALAMVNSSNKKKKEEGNPASSGGTGGDDDEKEDKRLSPADGKEFYQAFGQEVANTIVDSMDTISMFMDFAIEETQRALEEIQELHDKALDRVNESADKIKELNAKLKDSADTNKAAVQEQLADEQLLYAKRLAEEKKLQEEEKKLKNKAAQQEAKARKVELATQMVMGIANTAQGVTKALASFIPPYSIILAAAIGALGAVQVGLIAAQMAKVKPVKYAEGGILSGPSHSQGGIKVGATNIEVEGGEMVVSKKNTERYKDVLYKINHNDPSVRYLQGNTKREFVDTKIRKYADGGTLNFESADATLRANNSTDRLMNAINDIDMQPIVSVVDIARVEDRLVRVRGLAGR